MKTILSELEQILLTIPSIGKVSNGKPLAITQEDTFNAIYIVPDNIKYKPYKQGAKSDTYDQFMFVKLYINCSNELDPLAYTDLHETIVRTVLSDNKLWTVLVDRDVLAVTFDDNENYPKKEFEILFQFRFRDSC